MYEPSVPTPILPLHALPNGSPLLPPSDTMDTSPSSPQLGRSPSPGPSSTTATDSPSVPPSVSNTAKSIDVAAVAALDHLRLQKAEYDKIKGTQCSKVIIAKARAVYLDALRARKALLARQRDEKHAPTAVATPSTQPVPPHPSHANLPAAVVMSVPIPSLPYPLVPPISSPSFAPIALGQNYSYYYNYYRSQYARQ